MYKVTIFIPTTRTVRDMDKNLGLFKACERADLYKARNPKCSFSVENEENGDIEYQV